MRKTFLLISLLSIIVGCCSAKSLDKPFDYQKITLDNGLTVITLEDFSCPIVSVQMWYQVGSKNEDPNRQGFAHMFEHMMFRGTEKVGPEEHFTLIRSVGGTVNGYTSFDKTVYLETLPANQLKLALWLEAERMAFLKIDQENFDTERKVVEEELRMRQNKPYGTVWEKIFAGFFKNNPYRWMPIGQISHLRAASVEELRRFWLKYYGPENATLIIVGAVKHKEAQELARKYFQWIHSKPKPKQIKFTEPVAKDRNIVIKGEKAPSPIAGIGWLICPAADKDSIALDLLAKIWGNGNSSRLYKELVDKKQLAIGAEADTYQLQQAGLFGGGAVLKPIGVNIDNVIELMAKQMDDIRKNGVSQNELDKAKLQMLKDRTATNLKIENKAKLLGYATIELGNTEAVNAIDKEIKDVNLGDIGRIANKYLTRDKMYKVRVEQNITGPFFSVNSNQENTPITGIKETNPPKPGRGNSSRPGDYPAKPPLTDINNMSLKSESFSKTLSNGLNVLVVPNKEVPFVNIRLGLFYGAWSDEKPGTCAMTMAMLKKGCKGYTANKIAEELDNNAIGLSASADIDTASVTANSLSSKKDKAVEMMAKIALTATFDANEFEKLKQKRLASLAIKQQSPEYIADKYFRLKLYQNHPYSRDAAGETNDINTLSADICKNWWKKHFQPDAAVLIFAGDITADEAFKLAEKNFGQLKNTVKFRPADFNLPTNPKKTHIYLIDSDGSAQSQIRVGQIGITRHQQPQYFIGRLVSDCFGLGFGSRLNKSIRIDKGLTYAIWGGFFPKNLVGEFKIQTFSKTDSTAETIKAIMSEINKLKQHPATNDELAKSKAYIAGSFIRNRETPSSIANDLWMIKSQHLSRDYLDRFLNGIKNTSINDVHKVTDMIEPGKMVIVVVGDAEKLKDDLSKIATVSVIK